MGMKSPLYISLNIQCLIVAGAQCIFVESALSSLEVPEVTGGATRKGWLALALGMAVTVAILDESQAKERWRMSGEGVPLK